MSKKDDVLCPAEKTVSPSQVYLEKTPPHVLNNVFGTGSENNVLQAEEAKSSKQSPCKRPKTKTKSGATSSKRNRPAIARKKVHPAERDSKPAQKKLVLSSSNPNVPKPARSMTIVGTALTPRPRSASQFRDLCVSTSPCAKPSSLVKTPTSWEVDNGKKACILTAIKPCNVDKEKIKFFKSDFAYNPKFEYSHPVSPLVLAQHNSASDRFLTQAVHIMELALKRYGSYEKFEQATGGALLTESRIWQTIKKYMEKEGCFGEILVRLTDDLLSRASLMVVNNKPKLTINVCTAREQWLEGMLRHEIGTHYYRGLNNCHQPWSTSDGRRKYNLKPPNPTEEGLASIHSVLFRRDPTLWRAALLYYTVYQASHMSFSQLFHNLGRFVKDPNTRWDYCVRAKRGQTNTALPGCFGKDQVYLDGILKILRYREEINFPLLMALGKVSYEDVERLKEFAQMEKVRIPHFMQDQARYAEELSKIMAVNQLTDAELKSII